MLISIKGDRTYTGHTANLAERLKAHNEGSVKSSKRFKPYTVLFTETFDNIQEAKERELFYKSSTGRYQLRKFVTAWKISQNI